jgi:hypothetical protein
MGGFLKRLFREKKTEHVPVQSCEGEPLEAVYQEFCATFCHKPGVNFMTWARGNTGGWFFKWLHPDSNEPEPKAILRLLVDMTRSGQHVWELDKGFSMYHEGSWHRGGGPSDETCAGLNVLAEAFGLEFKVYYTEFEDGPYMVKRFTPPGAGD